jgi:hypothetical protein
MLGASRRNSALEKSLNYRKSEARCFSRAGLRETDQIATAQREWNRLGLDRGGSDVAGITNRIEQLGNQPELVKGRRYNCFRRVCC